MPRLLGVASRLRQDDMFVGLGRSTKPQGLCLILAAPWNPEHNLVAQKSKLASLISKSRWNKLYLSLIGRPHFYLLPKR